MRLEDDRSAFVKAACEPEERRRLWEEWLVYSHVAGAFLARCHGWLDRDDVRLLVLEDLDRDIWPPPWSPGRVERVHATLDALARTQAPAGLPSLESRRERLARWTRVAADPTRFLSLGACDEAWLEEALPALLQAELAARLEGDSLVHLGVRSHNICLTPDRAVLVDWAWASRGNAGFDVASWLPALEAEGGPPPETLLPSEPELASLVAGYYADVSSRSARSEVEVARLGWASRALSLRPPPGWASHG